MQSRVVRAGYASTPDEGIKDPAHDSGKSRRAGSHRQANAGSSGIRNRRMINRAIKMGMCSIFLVYAFISQAMFEAFACRDLGPETGSWLAVDFTLPKMVAAGCVPAVEDQRILLSQVCVRGDLLSRPDAE